MPLPFLQTHWFLADNTGYWINRCSTRRNWILLFLCACYNIKPSNLQSKCEGCLQTFYVNHTPSCSNRGLVIARHNEICYKIIHLDRQALSPVSVCDGPLIRQGLSRSEEYVCHSMRFPETRVDVLIRGLNDSHMEAIIGVRFGDSDTETYKKEGM